MVQSMAKKKSKLGTKSKKPTRKERADDDELTKARRRRGRSVRARGHAFEREIANSLKEIFPEARRLLENHKDDARGVDILHTGPYRFQCKRMGSYAKMDAIEEVQCDEMLGEVPVLVAKADKRRTLAVLPYEELLRLLARPEA